MRSLAKNGLRVQAGTLRLTLLRLYPWSLWLTSGRFLLRMQFCIFRRNVFFVAVVILVFKGIRTLSIIVRIIAEHFLSMAPHLCADPGAHKCCHLLPVLIVKLDCYKI